MTRQIVSKELHIRRLPVHEALYQLERYLDSAFLEGYLWVRIIHGKGQGILRQAVWERLRSHPLVSDYRLGFLEEGDTGVTLVQMAQY